MTSTEQNDQSKPLYQSKMMGFNALVPILYKALTFYGVALPLSPEDIMIAMGVINIWLRYITDKPVRKKKPKKA